MPVNYVALLYFGSTLSTFAGCPKDIQQLKL